MAKRETNRLDPLRVTRLCKSGEPGRYSDGGGLYLIVDRNGATRWSFIFRWRENRRVPGPGRLREMGLGSTLAVSLKRAREKAAAARELLADGIDPIAARKAADGVPTFGEVADEVLAVKSQEARSGATVNRMKRALEVYAADLRPIRVDAVETADVLKVLKPIWLEKPETAHKARGLIEAVLNAAKAKGHRTGENPAAWKGHLDHLLPKRSKLTRGHHAAMKGEELPGFIQQLRQREATAALALEFVILTACRTSEALGARWSEIDLERKVWIVPAHRMKAGKEHRVPLSARAVEILRTMKKKGKGELVFPGQKPGSGMTGMAFDQLRDRMGVTGVTTHGFRSTFRDWVSEETDFPRELAEAALAHTVGDQTERAYRRGDALERRDWRSSVGTESREGISSFMQELDGVSTSLQRRLGVTEREAKQLTARAAAEVYADASVGLGVPGGTGAKAGVRSSAGVEASRSRGAESQVGIDAARQELSSRNWGEKVERYTADVAQQTWSQNASYQQAYREVSSDTFSSSQAVTDTLRRFENEGRRWEERADYARTHAASMEHSFAQEFVTFAERRLLGATDGYGGTIDRQRLGDILNPRLADDRALLDETARSFFAVKAAEIELPAMIEDHQSAAKMVDPIPTFEAGDLWAGHRENVDGGLVSVVEAAVRPPGSPNAIVVSQEGRDEVGAAVARGESALAAQGEIGGEAFLRGSRSIPQQAAAMQNEHRHAGEEKLRAR